MNYSKAQGSILPGKVIIMSRSFPDEQGPFTAETSARNQYVCLRRNTYDQMKRQLFYLWTYMIQEDIWTDAIEFMEDNSQSPTPFDMLPYEMPYFVDPDNI